MNHKVKSHRSKLIFNHFLANDCRHLQFPMHCTVSSFCVTQKYCLHFHIIYCTINLLLLMHLIHVQMPW